MRVQVDFFSRRAYHAPAVFGKKKSIRVELLKYYSLLIVGIIALSSLSFYVYATTTIRKNVIQAFEALSQTQARLLDDEIRNIDAFSISLIFSDRVRQELLRDRQALGDPESKKHLLALDSLVYEMLGPFRTFWQLNCYSLGGSLLGLGNNPFIQQVGPAAILSSSRVQRSLDGRGKKELFVDSDLISLCRAFGSVPESMEAVLEVQNKAEEVFRRVESLSGQQDLRVFIFAAAGEQVFPPSASGEPYREAIQARATPTGHFFTTARAERGSELVCYAYSEYTDWTLALVAPRDQVSLPIRSTSFLILGLSLVSLAMAQLLSYFVAGRISRPIRQVHSSVNRMHLSLIPQQASRNKALRLNELEELDLEFQELCIRLKKSIEESMQLRAREMESRLLALQARMNPHFLYNILGTISSMAEEGLTSEIGVVCDDLSQMLRYVSDGGSAPVLLGDELDHTERYLALMKMRHGDSLSYRVEVPMGLRTIQVPRLIVQPLVENSLKHGGRVAPPWNIRVTGAGDERGWTVTIADNAGGFDPDKREWIQDRIRSFDDEGEAAQLGIEGMGILNIFYRLRIKFGKEAILRIDASDGGAVVTVGRRCSG